MAHILLVDDNEIFRASVRTILEHAGYEVSEAGDRTLQNLPRLQLEPTPVEQAGNVS